ncbi:MAG TPA: hypothetical protein VGQ83_21585, partial [Polyangia bacterium]
AGTLLRLGGPLPTPAGGACARPIPLACSAAPTTYRGSTAGRPAAVAGYGCAGARLDAGPEATYRLDSPVTGAVTVRLRPHEADLDLVAVGAAPGGGCDATDRCLAASQGVGLAEETVIFPVSRGGTYFVIVDGPTGAASGYTLTVSCAKE